LAGRNDHQPHRKYLNSRAAAEYLGYQPERDTPRDPQMKAFYAFADRQFPEAKRRLGGRLLFDLAVIEARLQRGRTSERHPPIDATLSDAQRLAIAHARGQSIQPRRYSPKVRQGDDA
jgi:hypothetical protein